MSEFTHPSGSKPGTGGAVVAPLVASVAARMAWLIQAGR